MKALSLHGPWAAYERRNADSEACIAKLVAEVAHWRQQAECSGALATSLQAQVQQQLPYHKDEAQRACALVDRLDGELRQAQQERDEIAAHAQQLKTALAALSVKADALSSELAKAMHTKSSTAGKLDEIRRKLGLSECEGQQFIKELDSEVTANKTLRSEVAELTLARTHLQHQCDSRSQHCMTLIAEGKRNAEQVSELRRQVLDLQHEEWQLKQQLAALRKHHERKAPAVHKERPSWQGAAVRQQPQHEDDVKGRTPRGATTSTDEARRLSSDDLGTDRRRSQVVREVLALRKERSSLPGGAWAY